MFCTACGTQVDETARFCPKCGTELTPSSTPAQPGKRRRRRLLPTLGLLAAAILLAGVGLLIYRRVFAPGSVALGQPVRVGEWLFAAQRWDTPSRGEDLLAIVTVSAAYLGDAPKAELTTAHFVLWVGDLRLAPDRISKRYAALGWPETQLTLDNRRPELVYLHFDVPLDASGPVRLEVRGAPSKRGRYVHLAEATPIPSRP